MNKGKLYLIPNVISENTVNNVISPQVFQVLPNIHHFLVEDIRDARRFLSSLRVYDSIDTLDFQLLDKDTRIEDLPSLMTPLFTGFSMGVISQAGCPGVADPGSLAVAYAHSNDIMVVPLVGPSSILLALMAAGLSGQQFAFHGYLPIELQACAKAIQNLEKESRQKRQTQIVIETPYRNNRLRQALLANLRNDTMLSIALDLTGDHQMIKTLAVKEWKHLKQEMSKDPAVFMFLAN
jgi:16S rRNA (cytidine1402-2'-O)-methyltransferase